jgi:site-specific DNA-methyltransferase (adenine-specific)
MRDRPTGDRRRHPTSTSNFGAGRREAHDASAFYARFETPELSGDASVAAPQPVDDPFIVGDARHMDGLADGTVALVVTSPPYFAGKQYEQELDREGIPGSYLEYLDLLRDVFADCKRVLEPGGRIAVNVANLGRRPYRSLASDVIRILQDDLRLLLRGEIVWRKGEGAASSCAWGSFRSPANPVLRDLTERVIVASKGRFDRALDAGARRAAGLPHEATLTTDEFMAATLDVWEIPPESARRVGHPAPFPVALPERLIGLYTYVDDLVLDPFMGSGSTLVAAARTGRRYIGYDLDPEYAAIARQRVAVEGAATAVEPVTKPISAFAIAALEEAGFRDVAKSVRVRGSGVTADLAAFDRDGVRWYFDVTGSFTITRDGLARTDSVWRSLGRAHVLVSRGVHPLVFLSSSLPAPGSDGERALRAVGPDGVFDVIDITDEGGRERLAKYAVGGQHETPQPGFWNAG